MCNYHARLDVEKGIYYDHRKNYDESVLKINQVFAKMLDKKQLDAQKMYPHYYERYKTDGVEFNMYIGHEIAQKAKFEHMYLKNLRLWQLQTIVEMENQHYQHKEELTVPLDVASLVLVYSSSLAIRFRLDEKNLM